jgi:hypothetical protein
MNIRSHFLGKPIAIASVFLVSIVLVACEQSQQPNPASVAPKAAVATEKVFVVFEGPWAIVSDPKSANSILALAPKTKNHRDLNVAASNNANLAAGVYDLSVPGFTGGPAGGTLDPTFAQAKIDPKNVQSALDNKSGRYAIRLPRPNSFIAAKRVRSRFGDAYPPTAEQNYITAVSLVYNASSLNGFSLSGTPDAGTFNPLLLQLDSSTISFLIEPAMLDDPTDRCSIHSREAFRDTTKLLGVSLYVDFPADADSCHNTDPQKARAVKAAVNWATTPQRASASASGNVVGGEQASLVNVNGIRADYPGLFITSNFGEATVRKLMAAMYFFHVQGTDCKAPIVFGTPGP